MNEVDEFKDLIKTLKFQRGELKRVIARGDDGSPQIRRAIEEARGYLKKVEEILRCVGQLDEGGSFN